MCPFENDQQENVPNNVEMLFSNKWEIISCIPLIALYRQNQ